MHENQCNDMVRTFLSVCQSIGCPVSAEKTEFTNDKMVFLGILLDGANKFLAVPVEKKCKAINLLLYVIDKKKIKVHLVQKLTGLLNFLQRAIVPGRSFTRAMYNKLKLKGLCTTN